ncbi:hypothetical protein ACS0TY_033307 [Phlomoides rotata]
MGTGAERFTMSHELRWGNQHFLRCMKVNSEAPISPLRRHATINSDQPRRTNCPLQSRTAREIRGRQIDSSPEFLHGSRKVSRTPPPASDSGRRFSGYDDGITATREEVMLDLQTAADQMKFAIFKDGPEKGEVYKLPPPPASAESELSLPWNLRTRRADLKMPASRLFTCSNVDAAAAAGKSPMVNAPRLSQMKVVDDKPMRLRSGGGAAASGGKKERPKFSVALSKSEIEEDFYSVAGHRPPRRPKKRNRNVQRQLDTLFPGLWLSEVTPDMYRVPEGEFSEILINC